MAIEGMLATIINSLGYSDTQTNLSIISTLSGDQAALRKLEEDLDAKKKLSVELLKRQSWRKTESGF